MDRLDQDQPDKLLTTREVATELGIGITSLYVRVLDQPDGIPRIRIGRSVRLHVDDVKNYIERRRQTAVTLRPTGHGSSGRRRQAMSRQ